MCGIHYAFIDNMRPCGSTFRKIRTKAPLPPASLKRFSILFPAFLGAIEKINLLHVSHLQRITDFRGLNKMKTFAPISLILALFAVTLGHAGTAEAQVSWRTAMTSCLPQAGKMQRIVDGRPIPTCHCPPKKYCPTTIEEWNDAMVKRPEESTALMPHDQIPLCCDRPYQCTIEHVAVSGGSGCTTFQSSGPVKSHFCSHYKPVAIPKSTDKKIEEANVEERKKRDAAAQDINSCMRSRCESLRLKVVDNTPKTFLGKTSSNATAMAEYAKCELDCRADAAKMVSIDPKTLDRSFYEKALVAAASYLGMPMPTTGVDILTARSPRPAEIPAGQGLEGKLTCDQKFNADICYSAIVAVACPPPPAPPPGPPTPPQSRDCFSAGTLVQLSNGQEVAIETLARGQQIRGLTATNTVAELVALDWDEVKLYRINGALLELTPEHPIMTSSGWKAINFDNHFAKYGLKDVGKLEVGDMLTTETGPVEVTSIEALPPRRNVKTYTLRQTGDGTFYANGVIVKDALAVD